MKCEKCNGAGYIPGVTSDEPCSKCSVGSDEFQSKIIAAWIRSVNEDEGYDCDGMNDAQVIKYYGGSTSNRIIGLGHDTDTYLYRSIDSTITVYVMIDMNALSSSKSAEGFCVPDPNEDGDLLDSDDKSLECVSQTV